MATKIATISGLAVGLVMGVIVFGMLDGLEKSCENLTGEELSKCNEIISKAWMIASITGISSGGGTLCGISYYHEKNS
ncbi:hypothetical protein BD31_I1652 [Candidatus Nitrosopumilus salaria BD31]|uniref:Uncharacterized protein n=1 Tax=Candidatus Nitrosopumilus salarius BD31 TaxID=859350 RepID=I3D142_9ARCH|nr:hypothetical protein [Candidatus Nitrosopumilus salaria]EIJ65435.1 hypothetical protein BD31_I1652 [Candidatus Nitrosopumilus salaria BD31]